MQNLCKSFLTVSQHCDRDAILYTYSTILLLAFRREDDVAKVYKFILLTPLFESVLAGKLSHIELHFWLYIYFGFAYIKDKFTT